jgi:ribosomal protein S18 acetylase RimI-like enzyme
MSAGVYDQYVHVAVKAYADEIVESGRWSEEGAVERSQADFDSSLPQGLNTADNFLFEIKVARSGPTVGYIWFAVEEKHGLRFAFVYDFEIKPEFRRQGHATSAFKALEMKVQELGLSSIGLHVFGHNLEAQNLYKKLGYKVTGFNMLKNLGAN